MNLISRPTNIVVGLTLDGGVLTAIEVKRTNGSVQVLKQVSAPLALDPLRDESELVGREIRNVLNGAGISTRRCIAGIPAIWALAVHSKLPPVEGDDLKSFLELEAERGFACNVDELQITSQIYDDPGGERYATIIGVPKSYLERFEAVLLAAQLKPASISLGLLALPNATASVITAEIADSRINLLVSSSAGLLALRGIEGAFETEGAEKRIQGELLARELRITLGQLDANIRHGIRQMQIFGERRFADQLVADIQARGRSLNLQPRHVTEYTEKHHGVNVPTTLPVSSALSLAVAFLSDSGIGYEFLPPKPTMWEQFATRYAGRRLAYIGGAAAAVLALVIGLFAYQQWQLSGARDEWASMKDKVAELEGLQDQTRKFRAWHDTSLKSMNIIRWLTESFPEDGAVSAKIIEIQDGAVISCSGSAKDSQSLLATIDRLGKSRQVHGLRVDQMRGKAPVQFTFNFQWGPPINED